MRLPVPTGREVRGAFYVLAACALALTVTLCWAIVHKVNQSDEIVHIASASADTIERLNAKVDAQNAAADEASAERSALRKQLHAVRASQRALLGYFKANGIPVPEAALSPPDAGPPPKHQTPSGASPKPKPRTPSPRPTPTPAPSPTPDDPSLICKLAPLLCP